MTYKGRKKKKEYDANLVIESTLGGKEVNFFDAKGDRLGRRQML